MPYYTNDDLPPPLRLHLSQHAQDIYREAFNHAWQQHGPEHEEVAHRIAWAAVKRQYERLNDEWVPRDREW